MKRPRSRVDKKGTIPPFTGSIDAGVPAENVVLSHYMKETNRWVAASEATDGRVFFGNGATEPLARRAAGLRTLAHLKARATGEIEEQTEEELEKARSELNEQIAKLDALITGSNGVFPADRPREVILVELRALKEVAKHSKNRPLVARLGLPALQFLSGAFAEGIIGAYAEKALDALSEFLSA